MTVTPKKTEDMIRRVLEEDELKNPSLNRFRAAVLELVVLLHDRLHCKVGLT
jgi:hypothetical protein